MKIIAYILFILQIVAFVGSSANYGWTDHFSNLFFFNGLPGFMEFLGFLFPTWLGIVLLVLGDKRQAKKAALKNVIFYCPNCGGVNGGAPGQAQGCPVCHKPVIETPVSQIDWDQMSAEEQASCKESWTAGKG